MSRLCLSEEASPLNLVLQEFARNVLQILARKTPHALLENSNNQQQLDVSSVGDRKTVAIEETAHDERSVEVIAST